MAGHGGLAVRHVVWALNSLRGTSGYLWKCGCLAWRLGFEFQPGERGEEKGRSRVCPLLSVNGEPWPRVDSHGLGLG